ncbi:hypothetical protein ACC713_30400 [Rhizobium johnstonii]|uniref:hypothetical protein n=1 Tax=Rhizobium johnstonii TaxID=3019933 RepID=UPI003F9988FD
MARRRVQPVDLMSRSTPTKIHMDGKSHPLRIVSPTHSVPGKKPKTFDFRVLDKFGPLGNQIAVAFIEFNSEAPYVSASGRAVSLRSFFSYVVNAKVDESVELKSLSQNQWRAFASGWFLEIKARKEITDVTRNNYLYDCATFFEYLSRKRLVPLFPWPSSIPNVKNKHRPGVAHATTIEASAKEIAAWPKQDQADWKKLQSLATNPSPKTDQVRSDLIRNIVRRHAECEVREAWYLYEQTRSIIDGNTTFDFDSYCREFETVSDNRLTRKYGWQRELSTLPNALVYIDRKFGGVLPGMDDDPHFLKFIYKDFGKAFMTGRFHLEYDSLAPLLTLVLMDRRKMNVSSPVSMLSTDLEQIVGGDYRAKWTKRRAKYRRLKDDMPTGSKDALARESTDKITAAQALLVIDELSKPLRPHAVPGAEDSLCLVRTVRRRVAAWRPLPSILNRKWHEFRLRSGVLSKLEFTQSQYRPTGAIEVFRETGDITKVAEELGQKDLRVTARYIQGLEAEATDAANTRPVQDALIIAAANVSGRPTSDFGISEQRKSEVLNAAHSAGFFGYNLSSSSEEAEVKVSLFEKILSGVKLFLFETTEVAAEIIAFRQHILDNGQAIRGTPRYEELWLPIALTCTHLIDSMSPKIVRDANKLLLERPIKYGPVT